MYIYKFSYRYMNAFINSYTYMNSLTPLFEFCFALKPLHCFIRYKILCSQCKAFGEIYIKIRSVIFVTVSFTGVLLSFEEIITSTSCKINFSLQHVFLFWKRTLFPNNVHTNGKEPLKLH